MMAARAPARARRRLAPAILLLAATLARADAGSALDRYLQGFTSLRTDFTQTVTDAHGAKLETGTGTLLVQRPGRFRWDYQPGAHPGGGPDAQGSGQLLVADGRNLWFYDRDLAQVTVKPVASVLSPTPVMLLSGSTADLQAHFQFSAVPAHDGLAWVGVVPQDAAADFNRAELGFDGDALRSMVIHDRLGQTVRVDFQHGVRNARIDAALFTFTAPAGVDVIGTPEP